MSYDDTPHYGSYAGSLIWEVFRLNSSLSICSGRDFLHKISAVATPKSASMRKNQDIGEMLPILLVSLTPGHKIVKRTSSNTVVAAYVNGYKLPPLYPSSDGFLIDP